MCVCVGGGGSHRGEDLGREHVCVCVCVCVCWGGGSHRGEDLGREQGAASSLLIL